MGMLGEEGWVGGVLDEEGGLGGGWCSTEPSGKSPAQLKFS